MYNGNVEKKIVFASGNERIDAILSMIMYETASFFLDANNSIFEKTTKNKVGIR